MKKLYLAISVCLTVVFQEPALSRDVVQVICPFSADAMVSCAPKERLYNWGAYQLCNIRANEKIALAKVDMTAARGLTVLRAWLNWYMVLSHPFRDGEVSTIAAPWDEGLGQGRPARNGECCFEWASFGRSYWDGPGSDLLDVSFGRGGSMINSELLANRGRPDRWGRCELDATLAQSLVAGTRFGIAVRSLVDNDSIYYFLSREWKGFPAEVGNSRYGGYLVVEGVYADTVAPAGVEDLAVALADKQQGSVLLEWTAAGDDGQEGRAARVMLRCDSYPIGPDSWEEAAPVGIGCIPVSAGGSACRALLDRLPGYRPLFIALRTVDEAGNVAPVSNICRIDGVAGNGLTAIRGLSAKPGPGNGEITLSWKGFKGPDSPMRVLMSSEPINGANARDCIPRGTVLPGLLSWTAGGLVPGGGYFFTLQPGSGIGNLKDGIRCVSARAHEEKVPRAPAVEPSVPAPADCSLNIWACGDMARIHPVTGGIFEDDPEHYGTGSGFQHKLGNRVWDGASGTVNLHCARGETVAFQLCLEAAPGRTVENVQIEVDDLRGPETIAASQSIKLFRQWYIEVADNWFPVGLVPLEMLESRGFDIPDTLCEVPGQRNQALWIDCWIPKDTPPGTYLSRIVVRAGGIPEREIVLRCEVSPFELPDKLSYCMHFMDYNTLPRYWGLRGDDPRLTDTVVRNFMRMAHTNRVNLGILPYRNNGLARNNTIISGAPGLDGSGEDINITDWSAYDRCWGPYYDGSAFEGLPRAGVPVSHAYLPFHLSWPTPIMDHQADKTAYEKAYLKVCSEFECHIEEMGWNSTTFMIYHNEKRKYGFPADMDEPMAEGDYWWLEYIGGLIGKGFSGPVKGKRVAFRIDLSIGPGLDTRLDSLVDLWVMNRIFFNSALAERAVALGAGIWEYGGMTNIDQSLSSALFVPWQSYLRRARGYVLWSSMGWGKNPWKELGGNGHQFAFLPGKFIGYDGPVATIRLKAARRAQQDMEYIFLAEAIHGRDRVEKLVRQTTMASRMEDYFKARETLRRMIEDDN
ncbi:MAG: DUF4091 domain-containing protein [Gemmatimonadota bacterium]|nr:DUF4091 domain-containing protein [Gemmatimonadota bacterium]